MHLGFDILTSSFHEREEEEEEEEVEERHHQLMLNFVIVVIVRNASFRKYKRVLLTMNTQYCELNA